MYFRIPVCVFLLSLPLFSEAGGTMTTDAQTFFSEHYDNSVIEIHNGGHDTIFPSLTLYRVFEKRNLVEDPLVPDIWIRTGTGALFPASSIEQALKEDRVEPENRRETHGFAREIDRIRSV